MKKNVSIMVSAACVAALVSTVAMGQAPAPGNTTKALEKWMADNKVTLDATGEQWRIVARTPDGVNLRRVRMENAQTPGVSAKSKTVVMRLELFEPIKDGANTISSITIDYDLDCQKRQTRQMVVNAFPNRNLSGRATSEKLDEPWVGLDKDPMLKAVADDVCQDISGNRGGQLGGSLGKGGSIGGR
jgi:hypothetical protein